MRKGTKPSKPSLSTHTQQIANNINSANPLTYTLSNPVIYYTSTSSPTQLSFSTAVQSISINGMDDLVTSSVVKKNASMKDRIKLLKADNIILNHKLKICTDYLESLERASADDIKTMKPIRVILTQLYD